MARAKPWLKMWVVWIHDPDYLSLTLAEQGAWWRLYTLAQELSSNGRISHGNGRALTMDEMTTILHLTRKADSKVFREMIEKRIRHGNLRWDGATLVLTDFAAEQMRMPSSDSGERVRRHRARAAVTEKSLQDLAAELRDELMALPASVDRLAQHESMKDTLARLGAENGLTPRSEYSTDEGRLDLVWETPKGEVLVAFEIDLRTPREKSLRKLEAIDCPFRMLFLRNDSTPFATEDNVLVVGLGKERESTKEKEERQRKIQNKTRNSVTPVTPDTKLALIAQLHEKNFGIITPIIAEKMRSFCETFKGNESWIQLAFDEALARKKRTWGYVEAILNSFEDQGGPHGKQSEQRAAPTGESGEDALEGTRRAGWNVHKLRDTVEGDED